MYKWWITKRCKHASCKCLNDVLLEIRCHLSTDSLDQPLGESTHVSDFQFVTSSYVHSKTQLLHIFADGSWEWDVADISKDLPFFFVFFSHNPPAICSPPSTKMLLLELPTPFKAQHTVHGGRSTVFSMLVLLSKSLSSFVKLFILCYVSKLACCCVWDQKKFDFVWHLFLN